MRYVEWKTDPPLHVCQCPVHGLYHFEPKTDLTEGTPPARGQSDVSVRRQESSDEREREHDRLKRITRDLEREHEALHDMPHDRQAHKAHRDRLRYHIQDLHAHIERMKKKR